MTYIVNYWSERSATWNPFGSFASLDEALKRQFEFTELTDNTVRLRVTQVAA